MISSSMHMIWMRTVAGRLKTDYRYSSTLVYNTFPFPNITKKQKEDITELVNNILDARDSHKIYGKPLADYTTLTRCLMTYVKPTKT